MEAVAAVIFDGVRAVVVCDALANKVTGILFRDFLIHAAAVSFDAWEGR